MSDAEKIRELSDIARRIMATVNKNQSSDVADRLQDLADQMEKVHAKYR